MKIYFATWLTDKSLGASLTKHKVKTRLVSYHFLIEQKVQKAHIKEYYETGICLLQKN